MGIDIRRFQVVCTILRGAGLAALMLCGSVAAAEDKLPNFVLIFADDQGYQDLGCFGSPDIETPHIDQLAAEGMRFTDFYVAQSVCSASRAALMTGCYSNRVGILGALSSRSKTALNHDETTVAEILKTRGYATAIYGKWHLGCRPPYLPLQHGFDDYYGLPYSNDMWPFHPTAGKSFPPLPLISKNEEIAHNPDQTQLTTSYTEHAVQFIDQNHDRPFFLYVPHSMPHVPLFVSEKYRGKSVRGLYGDVISEIDWSVGQIVAALDRWNLSENTLIIYTSDNGPWLSYGNHAGSALPLREGKGTTWEGGMREPCIMRWKGRIPAGTSNAEVAGTIDVLPTLARLAGADLPEGKPIDGKDIWPLMSGDSDAKSPHEAYYYYWNEELQAVRQGQWKLHFPHQYRSLKGEPGRDGQPGPYEIKKTDLALYDLAADISETTNVAEEHADIVRKMEVLAEKARADLGDTLRNRVGPNVRPAAEVMPQ